MTVSTHLLAKKIPSPPKPFLFPIQNSLHSAAFPLINVTEFPQNQAFCTQEMSTVLIFKCSNISTIFPDLPQRVPTFTLQT